MANSSSGSSRLSSSDHATTPIRSTRVASTKVVTDRSTALHDAYRFPMMVGAVHFVIVQLVATLAFRYGSSNSPSPPFTARSGTNFGMPSPHTGIAQWLVDPLRQWDGLWYRLVALDGYGPPVAKAAFWPLYPWAMQGSANLLSISTDTAGWIIANVSFFVALILLYRLVAMDFNERIARTTLWAIALFPTAFFFSAVYSEAPFLMLLVGALLAARKGHWWVAGVVGALAALTRSYGMFLILPFAVLLVQQRGMHIRRWFPEGIAVGLPLLGPALFSWHLNQKVDDPWAWRTVQEQWNRYSAMPWETLQWAFNQSPAGEKIRVRDGADWGWMRELANDPSWSLVTSEPWRKWAADSDTLELACTLLFLGLALIGIFKLPLYQTVYLIPGLVVPLFQPSSVHALMSMPRFGLTLFPLFIVIAILVSGRRIAKPLAVISTLLLMLLTAQFVQWYWVS